MDDVAWPRLLFAMFGRVLFIPLGRLLRARHDRRVPRIVRGNGAVLGPVPASSEGGSMIDRRKLLVAALSAIVSAALPVYAQQVADPGFASVGRGAPLAATLPRFVPPETMMTPPGPEQLVEIMASAARFPFVGPLSLGATGRAPDPASS
jgi:hypothetical protein